MALRRTLVAAVAVVASSCLDHPTVPSTGDAAIEIVVAGLPAGALANVIVTGDDGSRSVTGTTRISLAAGTYTVTAGTVPHGGIDWFPNVTTLSLHVASGQSRAMNIRYGRLPVNGAYAAGLDLFDSAVVAFMSARSIGAGTLTMSRGGLVFYRRAFGWRDSAHTEPLSPHALMRLASNSKPVTAAAVRRLVTEGQLTLGTKAFGFLGLSPAGAVADARIYDITVQHLLDHTGGWNRDVAGDFMFRSRDISRALGITSPPTKTQIAQWAMTQPLQHAPGAASSYSNFGYLVLGLIIEKVTGKSFLDYARQTFFAGSSANEIISGRSLRADRDPREPFYSDPFKGCSVFHVETCVLVPWPDGGWYLEAFDACGGLVASAPAMAAFLDAYWINGQPRVPGASGSFTFYGSLDGTFTMMRQRSDGTNIVVLFNQRTDPSGLAYTQIQQVLDAVSDRIFVAGVVGDRER
jgi:CubicO group peptidase (beta-lactamase class C family)